MAQSYRPIRTVASAVPDRIRELGERIDSLSVLTSGQVNSTSPELRRTAAELPTITTLHLEADGFTPSSDPVASQRVAVPVGKNICQALVTISGLVYKGGAAPSVRIQVGSETSPAMASIDTGSLCHLTGSFAALTRADRGEPLPVAVTVTGGSQNDANRLRVDAILTFTS